MDIIRARSPPATHGRRPIGPRNPGRAGTLPVKNIIPLDLTARLQEEIAAIPRTASPESVGSGGGGFAGISCAASPASAPPDMLRSHSDTGRSESSMSQSQVSIRAHTHAHGRTESGRSRSSQDNAGHWGLERERVGTETPAQAGTGTETIAGGVIVEAPTETETETRQNTTAPPPPTSEPPASSPGSASSAVDGCSPSLDDAPQTDTEDDAFAAATDLVLDFVAASPDVPPLQEVIKPTEPAAHDAVSPTDSIADDLLEMYIPAASPPPPPPIVPAERDTHSPTLRPPSVQTLDSPVINGFNGIHGVKAVNGINGVNGVDDAHRAHDQYSALSEKGVQASIHVSEPSTTASTRASTPALLKVVPKRPPLTPPTTLNFDFQPIRWKSMTLEAAQWTWTSEQLQETVSRAIRKSAAESFIHVVSTDVHDRELPQEMERLETTRATTQAQYRFNMHRRAMLLQSLAALSQSQTDTDGEALYNLATQLTELTASCDRQMETLLHVADQKAQIQHIQDLHVASALAMGLRKLNASYAKRTAELQETKARNEELRAELEEAWNMAQDMAQEMDDLDNFDLAFSDDEDEYTPNDEDEPSNSALEAEIYNDMDRMSNVSSMRHAEVIEITGKAIATKAMITNISGDGALKPGDRTSRVSAAKKRSSRASKASLRIPRTPRTPQAGNGEQRPDRTSIYSMRSIRSRRSRSKSRRAERGEQSNGVPDVPIIRLPEPSRSREGSFLELVQTRPASPAVTSSDKPPPLPPKGPFEHQLHLNIAAIRSEEVLAVPNPLPSPTFGGVPSISYPEEELQAQQKSFPGRRFFARRTHSMQPPLRAADDTASAAQVTRAVSESKHFDGWPFLNTSKGQRFSVPVLSAIPLRGRKSSDSAPAGPAS